MLKSLIWWNLLEKREPYRDAFLYENALKTDIYAVRFALTALFSFKKRNFLAAWIALFTKNAQFSRFRLALFRIYRRESKFIRRTVPYRTVPYRFPRGTVLVDRTAYRTFLTVFREFRLRARITLPRIKCSRFAVSVKARTVPCK
jgi:hypothetical protein